MKTNFDRIKLMDIYDLAEYIQNEQRDSIDAGKVVPIDEIIKYLKMEA